MLAAIRYPLLCLPLLAGCASQPCCVAKDQASAAAPLTRVMPSRLVAVGYGAMGSYSQQYTLGQQKLMAMRAAQVDAYRNLAEQAYGMRIWGNTAVTTFTTQNDSIRAYIDAHLRGARLVNMVAVADGNYEATVELDLSQQFPDGFVAPGNRIDAAPGPACPGPGCSAPSAFYLSN